MKFVGATKANLVEQLSASGYATAGQLAAISGGRGFWSRAGGSSSSFSGGSGKEEVVGAGMEAGVGSAGGWNFEAHAGRTVDPTQTAGGESSSRRVGGRHTPSACRVSD